MDMYIFVEYSTVQLCDLIFEYHIYIYHHVIFLVIESSRLVHNTFLGMYSICESSFHKFPNFSSLFKLFRGMTGGICPASFGGPQNVRIKVDTSFNIHFLQHHPITIRANVEIQRGHGYCCLHCIICLLVPYCLWASSPYLAIVAFICILSAHPTASL